MPQPLDLEVPHAPLPPFLQGIELPAGLDEAIDYAEAHGAPPEVIDFMESLPAAVFTTEEGLRHAFALFDEKAVAALEPGAVAISQDGISS
jgi:hypothetical protein